MSESTGRIVSVNIGQARTVDHNGRAVSTGIFKTPTDEPQRVAGVHIGDDVQADTDAHGGPDKAVYAYAAEDYEWWAGQIDNIEHSVVAALFGENLTTRGIDVSSARVGDRWQIGSVEFEVSEPRVPCFRLGIRTGVSRFQQTFGRSGRPGAYLRIVTEGELVVGDAVTVIRIDEPSLSMAEMATIYDSRHDQADRFLSVTRLSAAWKAWAAGTIERRAKD